MRRETLQARAYSALVLVLGLALLPLGRVRAWLWSGLLWVC